LRTTALQTSVSEKSIFNHIIFFDNTVADVVEDLYHYVNPLNKRHSPMVAKETLDIVLENKDRLNSAIIFDRDFSYNFFGFKVIFTVHGL
jgi:hypothetical protein